MAFDTNDPSKWLFDFNIIPGSPSGTTYPCTFNFYVHRTGDTAKGYYHGLTWNFTLTVDGRSYPLGPFKNSNNVLVPHGTTNHVCAIPVDLIISGYSVTTRNIAVSCSFTSSGSPRSGSGSKNINFPVNTSGVGKTEFDIINNGNNTISFKGKIGQNGSDNNKACNAHIFWNFDTGDPYAPVGSSSQYGTGVFGDDSTPRAGQEFNITPITITKDTTIKARSYTIAQLSDRPTFYKELKCEYYSRPKTPTGLKIEDNNNNTATITATKGEGGSHNISKGVQIQYRYNDTDNWADVPDSGIVSISGSILYVRARTVGSHTKGGDNIRYSEWIEISNIVEQHEAPGPSNVKVVDNRNNTFCFEVINLGADGKGSNPTSGVEIYYTTDGSSPTLNSNKIFVSGTHSSTTNQQMISNNITISHDMTIRYFCRTKGSYTGNENRFLYSHETTRDSDSVKYYKAPELGVVTIIYDKKLTKKSTITIQQPIKIYKNTNFHSCIITLQIYGKSYEHSWTIEGNGVNENNDYSNTISHIIDFKQLKQEHGITLKRGDRIRASITYNVYNGATEQNSVNNLAFGVVSYSDWYIVQSSGVMRVNVNDNWCEGQVWINVNGVWKEATDVFVKQENIWKESV